MKDSDLVSIITPMYNSQKYVGEMIESVINQSYDNWELIIVDDKSNDNSCNIVEKYCKSDSRIKLVKQEKNCGPAEARNVAIRNSKGNYIAFLDSDDIWSEKKLEIQIYYMKKNNSPISCTAYEMVSENLEKSLGKFEVPNIITYKSMLNRNYFSCDTVIINRKLVENVFMISYEKHEDYIVWLRLIKQVGFAHGINEILAYYRVGDKSRSSDKFSNIIPLFKIYHNIEGLNLISSLYYLVNYCFRSVFKYRNKIVKKLIQNLKK